MKRTLGIGSGRVRHGKIRVNGLKLWPRKRKKGRAKKPPIFYVTYKTQDGKRVHRSTRQRRRNVALSAAELIRQSKAQPELFATVKEIQPALL